MEEVKRIPYDNIYYIIVGDHKFYCSEYELIKNNDDYTLKVNNVLHTEYIHINCVDDVRPTFSNPEEVCYQCKHYYTTGFNDLHRYKCKTSICGKIDIGLVSNEEPNKTFEVTFNGYYYIEKVNEVSCQNKDEYSAFVKSSIISDYTKNLMKTLEEQKYKEELHKKIEDENQDLVPSKKKYWFSNIRYFLEEGFK